MFGAWDRMRLRDWSSMSCEAKKSPHKDPFCQNIVTFQVPTMSESMQWLDDRREIGLTWQASCETFRKQVETSDHVSLFSLLLGFLTAIPLHIWLPYASIVFIIPSFMIFNASSPSYFWWFPRNSSLWTYLSHHNCGTTTTLATLLT